MGLRNVGWLFALLFGFLLLSAQVLPVVHGLEGDEELDVDVEEEEIPTGAKETQPSESTPGSEDIEEDFETGVGEDILVPSPFVSTTFIFPDSATRKFTVGNEINLLLGFTNNGEETYNITAVGGHLHSPFDFSYYIQNFSVKAVGVSVGPHEQVSVEYNFKPDKSLEPLEFSFSCYVLYNSTIKNETFRNVFFNATIELVEKQSDVNIRRVFSYFFALAVAGLVAYFAYNYTLTKGNRIGRRHRASRYTSDSSDSGSVHATRAASVSSEWETPVYKQAHRSKVVRPKNKKKK